MIKLNIGGIIPIYSLTPEDKDISMSNLQIPENIAYLITGNGVMLFKRNREYVSLSKTNSLSSFPKLSESAIIKYPSIPISLLNAAIHFFRFVYNSSDKDIAKSESCVLFYLDKETGSQWKGVVPKQEVSPASVNYTTPTPEDCEQFKEINDYFLAGSIHSHASMSAGFSGVDDKDDLDFDGIHIVVGHIDKSVPEFAIRIMVSKQEYTLPFEQLIGTDEKTPIDLKEFEKQIHLVKEKPITFKGAGLYTTKYLSEGRYSLPFDDSKTSHKKKKKEKRKIQPQQLWETIDIDCGDMVFLRIEEAILAQKINPMFYMNNSPIYYGEAIVNNKIFDVWFNDIGTPIMVQGFEDTDAKLLFGNPESITLKEEVMKTLKQTDGMISLSTDN
jgi:hypothetical protein